MSLPCPPWQLRTSLPGHRVAHAAGLLPNGFPPSQFRFQCIKAGWPQGHPGDGDPERETLRMQGRAALGLGWGSQSWEGSRGRTLSSELWKQSHRWLLMARTSHWEALRWARHQGAGGSCVALRCERGYTWGQVPACIKRCGCLGGLAGGRAGGASGWKQLGWQSRPWRLATGGSAPQRTCFLV